MQNAGKNTNNFYCAAVDVFRGGEEEGRKSNTYDFYNLTAPLETWINNKEKIKTLSLYLTGKNEEKSWKTSHKLLHRSILFTPFNLHLSSAFHWRLTHTLTLLQESD